MSEAPSSPASPESPSRDRAKWGSIAVALVLGLLAAGLLFLIFSPGGHDSSEAGGTTTKFKPTTYHIVVRSLKINAPIVSIAMSRERVLTPPANPRDVGWWNASAKPGATAGQTIIAGHTVHTGGGQFDHLGELKKGSPIEIVRKKRTEHYVATKVFKLSKQEVSDQAQELFGQDRPQNRLVLITCGNWTGHAYLTNVFVYAKPVGETATRAQSAA